MSVDSFVERFESERMPQMLIVFGVILTVIMVSKIATSALSPYDFVIVVVVNFFATVPFISVLCIGGYWLPRSDISAERYPRILIWIILGFMFMTVFFAVIVISTQNDLLIRIGVVRWGVAAGAGSGALVGMFEARAINQAVTVERTQIRNEELIRQKDRLEEFVKILSHDLRNPLGVADGYVTVLREKYDDDELEQIASAHDRMERIIEETVVFVRSGQLIDELEPVSLAELVDCCWANVETSSATIEVKDTKTIVADTNRVRHLFENLFRNAVEHAGKNVTVRVGTLPNGFFIEDDGPGFPDDSRKITESGYSTKQDGTGFGLSIVRQIVEAHSWDITLTEANNGGARIDITDVDTDQPQKTKVLD